MVGMAPRAVQAIRGAVNVFAWKHFVGPPIRWSAPVSLVAIVLCAHPALSAVMPTADSTSVADTVKIAAPDRSELKWHSMLSNVPGDWVRYTRVTFREDKIPSIVGMVLLTGAMMVVDDQTWTMSNRYYQSSPVVRGTSDFFEYLGDGRPQFGLAAGFAVYGFAAGDKRSVRTASQVVEAILACGSVVQLLKHVTGRESPFVSSREGGRWDVFPNQIEYHKHVPHFDAYPSGHIATALATVTVVAENYPEWTWVKPVGYSIVALIGISMANTGIHWYSDYPLGLSLGYAFGMLAAHPEGLPDEHRAGNSADSGLSLLPSLGPNGSGFQIVFNF